MNQFHVRIVFHGLNHEIMKDYDDYDVIQSYNLKRMTRDITTEAPLGRGSNNQNGNLRWFLP